jgi:hypothetical protein
MQIDKKINAGKLFSSSLAFILNIQQARCAAFFDFLRESY